MDINSFVINFASQFDEAIKPEISASTKFRTIEDWSSLTALAIIAMVDEEYKVKITGDDIRNSQTIEDLYLIVKSRL